MNNGQITYVNKSKIRQLDIRQLAIKKINSMIEEEVKKGTSKEEIEELVKQFHNVVTEMLRQMELQQQFSYKGKDGKDYHLYETLTWANNQHVKQENPVEMGRCR